MLLRSSSLVSDVNTMLFGLVVFKLLENRVPVSKAVSLTFQCHS